MPVWLSALAHAADPSLEELLLATDDAQRGAHSVAVVSMHVVTDRYERSVKMQVWSKGTDRVLVKILEPAKDAGVATLKVEDNLWNYLPKVDRTLKVPAGMMSQSWMGSHFSNDDLVRESRLSEDFGCAIERRPGDPGGDGNYAVGCTPKPDAPVVWGKVVAVVRPDKMPVRIEFVDEGGTLVRTMTYGDYREVDGRLTPMEMSVVPADEPAEFTKITFESLDLRTPIDDAVFSLQGLK